MAPRGKLPIVMALTKKQEKEEEEKEKEEKEDPLRQDPMWQAIQGAGTALHRARGLHGLDRDTSKRWDFMHGASKEMLTDVIRQSGYQMPVGSEKWNIEAMRAYVKMQGINFIPNGYIVRDVGAAVKLQSAFRTFVLRRLISNLKAQKEIEDAEELANPTKGKKKTLKEALTKNKGSKMAGIVKSAEKQKNTSKHDDSDKDERTTPTKDTLANKKDMSPSNGTINETTPLKKEIDVDTKKPFIPIVKKSNHHPYLPHLLSEPHVKKEPPQVEKEKKAVKDNSLHYFDSSHVDMQESDRLAQQLLTRVDSGGGGISSPLLTVGSETGNSVSSSILNTRKPPSVEDLHAKELTRQRSRHSNLVEVDSDMKFEEFMKERPTPESTRRKERPTSAPMNRNNGRKTLTPIVCSIHTRNSDKRRKSKKGEPCERVKEGVFRRAMLGRPSSASARTRKSVSPSRYLSSRYPHMVDREHRLEGEIHDMEAGATWGDALAENVIRSPVSGSGAVAVKTLGVSTHALLNDDQTLPFPAASGQGNAMRVGKFKCKIHKQKSPFEVEEEQVRKLLELKKTRKQESESRQMLGVAMRAQYYHGGVLQDYTVERRTPDRGAQPTSSTAKSPKRRGSSRRVSEVNQPSKQYTPLQAGVQPVPIVSSQPPPTRAMHHTMPHNSHISDTVTGWGSDLSEFPTSPQVHIQATPNKKDKQRE